MVLFPYRHYGLLLWTLGVNYPKVGIFVFKFYSIWQTQRNSYLLMLNNVLSYVLEVLDWTWLVNITFCVLILFSSKKTLMFAMSQAHKTLYLLGLEKNYRNIAKNGNHQNLIFLSPFVPQKMQNFPKHCSLDHFILSKLKNICF